jgi:DNA-binding transcriptional LysR family regulator
MNLLNQMPSLIAFVRVVESGSFSAAARAAGMTPSAVSKGIGRLEAELGSKLFQRSTRSLHLTLEGRAFFDRVAPLLRGIEDSANAFRPEGGAHGLLRVSMPSEIGRLLMKPIAAFLASHGGLELDLSLSDRYVEVIGGGYDVVFRVGFPIDSELKSRTLASMDMALVATPGLLARHGQPATANQLASLPFVRYLMHGRALPITFKDGTSIQPRGQIGVDTGAALRAAALEGMGVTHIMRCTVQDDLDRGSLVVVADDTRLPSLPLHSLHAFGAHTPARVRLFTDFISREVQRLQRKAE